MPGPWEHINPTSFNFSLLFFNGIFPLLSILLHFVLLPRNCFILPSLCKEKDGKQRCSPANILSTFARLPSSLWTCYPITAFLTISYHISHTRFPLHACTLLWLHPRTAHHSQSKRVRLWSKTWTLVKSAASLGIWTPSLFAFSFPFKTICKSSLWLYLDAWKLCIVAKMLAPRSSLDKALFVSFNTCIFRSP